MIWSVIFIGAELLAAASLAAVRPFLSLVLVLLIGRFHASGLPAGYEWIVSAPVLGALMVLAGVEHWRKWREESGVLDLGHLRDLPRQATAAIGGVLIFESLRVAGPDEAVEMAGQIVARLSEKLPAVAVHLIMGAVVAALSGGLAKLHRRVERSTTELLGGSRWPARAEGAVVSGAASVVALSTWAVWVVAAGALLLVIGVGVFFLARRGVREGARRPCPGCGHRVAARARVCPECGAGCAPAT